MGRREFVVIQSVDVLEAEVEGRFDVQGFGLVGELEVEVPLMVTDNLRWAVVDLELMQSILVAGRDSADEGSVVDTDLGFVPATDTQHLAAVRT